MPVEQLYNRYHEITGEVALPLLRASKRFQKPYEAYRRSRYTPVHVLESDPASRMYVLEIDLPTVRVPVRYIFYISTQDWYLAPCKVPPKARKVLKKYRSMGYQADTYMAIIAKRYTRGAKKLAARLGVPLRSPREARRDMARYFGEKRLNGLLAALRGRRIYGELVFLAYALQELARELGFSVPELAADPLSLQRLAEEGMVVPQEGLPPPGAG